MVYLLKMVIVRCFDGKIIGSLWWFLSESGHRFIYYYIVLVKGGHFPYHNCCSKKRSTRNRFENTSLTHGDIAGSNRAGFNKQQMGFLPQPKWRGKLRKNWVNPQKPNRTNLQHLWSIVIIIIKIMIVLMLPHDMPETRTTMTLLNPNPHFLFFTMIHLTHHPPVSWWKYLQDLLCVWEKKWCPTKISWQFPSPSWFCLVKSTCFVRIIEFCWENLHRKPWFWPFKKGGFTIKIPSIESYIPRPSSPSAKALHSHLWSTAQPHPGPCSHVGRLSSRRESPGGHWSLMGFDGNLCHSWNLGILITNIGAWSSIRSYIGIYTVDGCEILHHLIDDKHPIIYGVSTILLVVQDFSSIHSRIRWVFFSLSDLLIETRGSLL